MENNTIVSKHIPTLKRPIALKWPNLVVSVKLEI